MKDKPTIYKFGCGHYGRDNLYGRAVTQFIRVGELRGASTVPQVKPCPECKAISHAPAA